MARTPDRSDRADRSDGGKTGSEELARILRERREELGMSRQDLADATGIPYPTVAQIETAYRGVSPARLGVIARVLGLDPKDLYDVLAAEGSWSRAPAPAAGSGRPRAGSRADVGQRAPAGAGWHVNPTFAAAMPMADSLPAPKPARSPARRPGAASIRAEAAAPLVSAPSGTGSARPPDHRSTPDEVAHTVVDLLATLPPDQRIEALGRVQNLLLERLLAERLAGDE